MPRHLVPLLLSLAASVAAQERYTSATRGFSIAGPPGYKQSTPGTKPGQAGVIVMFTGPAKNGFSPNVNVIADPTKQTRKGYRDTNIDELKKAGATIKSEKELEVSGRQAVLIEFAMGTGSKRLTLVTLGVLDPQLGSFTITSTAREKDAAASKDVLQACLDSFRVEGGAAPGAAANGARPGAEKDTTYESKELAFTLLQPKGWGVEVLKFTNPQVRFSTGPLKDGGWDGSVTVTRAPDNRDAEQLKAFWKRNCSAGNSKLLAESEAELAGKKAFVFDYETNAGAWRHRNVYVPIEGHYYSLEARVRGDLWATLEGQIKAIHESLKLVP